MTLSEIWEAIESGITVYWSNEAYKIHPIKSNGSKYAKETEKNGMALRCTCTRNYFGSLLAKKEFSKCFIKKETGK